MHGEIERRLELTDTEEPVMSGVVARVAGTLVLPYEVHTTPMGTEIRTQLTLVDVCLETKNNIEM
jgi:hypothetical protein